MPASARALASAATSARISAAILLPSRIVAGINLPLTVFADFHFIGKALFATESRRRRRTAKPKNQKLVTAKFAKNCRQGLQRKPGTFQKLEMRNGTLAGLSFSSAGVSPAVRQASRPPLFLQAANVPAGCRRYLGGQRLCF